MNSYRTIGLVALVGAIAYLAWRVGPLANLARQTSRVTDAVTTAATAAAGALTTVADTISGLAGAPPDTNLSFT